MGRARREISHNRDKIRALRESVKNWEEIAKILKKAFPDNKATDFALEEKGKMVRMDKDRFLQAIQDKIDELTKRAKEIIGKGEFDIDAHFYKARQEVQGLESIYANFHGEVNGVPFRGFYPPPNTSSGREERIISFPSRAWASNTAFARRNMRTALLPGKKGQHARGILISMQSLVPYGIGMPQEKRGTSSRPRTT